MCEQYRWVRSASLLLTTQVSRDFVTIDHHNLIRAVSADRRLVQPRGVLPLVWAGPHELHPMIPLVVGWPMLAHFAYFRELCLMLVQHVGVGGGALRESLEWTRWGSFQSGHVSQPPLLETGPHRVARAFRRT